jgi:hypothetical protein
MYITPLTPLQGEPPLAEVASSRLWADKIITRHLNQAYGVSPGSRRSFFQSYCGQIVSMWSDLGRRILIGLQSHVRCGASCLIALFAALSNQERSARKQLAPQLPYSQSQTDLKYAVRDEIEEATIGAGPQGRQKVLNLMAGGKWA